MDIKAERQARVRATMVEIHALLGDAAPDRGTLQAIGDKLQQLAQYPELFPLSDFPAPEQAAASSRYLLAQREDESCALYINVINPGKAAKPHNHGTWAVIAALSGEERNQLYRRTDDGSDPEHAQLEDAGEFVVKPGSPITFLPDDIHSIHVDGDETVRHFHLYGKALETLIDRLGFDIETGRVHGYNKTYMQPTAGRDR
ncbi:cysteine dioxygenase family protein [Candidimonas humi]|uniref:AraC family ligand binding domain-containing protein n=1 Tax=Candidimonas humi TaxID=683355 RepID=A0ABV8NSJ3_9BURK|nr:cysteine dioxygenase family protein [Candidimonas humi]MBV6307049.1 cysteine dioxygenase family protein [Candidimonas humi]